MYCDVKIEEHCSPLFLDCKLCGAAGDVCRVWCIYGAMAAPIAAPAPGLVKLVQRGRKGH